MPYVLIDCTNYKAIARAKEYQALAALAYIQFANVDTVIHPTTENRHYSQFSLEQLKSIYDGIIDEAAKGKLPFKTAPFNMLKTASSQLTDAITEVRAMIEAAPALEFPFSAAKMEVQAEKIKAGDDQPYAININGDTPKRITRWVVEPNRNRARYARGSAEQLTRNTGRSAAPLMTRAAAAQSMHHDRGAGISTVEARADPVLKMTDKAGGQTLDAFLSAGWTRAQLVEHGYAIEKSPNEKAASRPRVRTPDERMTEKAGGQPHAAFINAGWTDKELISHGYMSKK